MTKKEFDEIFESCTKQLLTLTFDQLRERIHSYSDENGKLTMDGIAVFAYMESIKYTNDLVYEILSRILDISE